MWIHDAKSLRFLEVNESAEHQYGYSREEFLSLTLNGTRLKQDNSGGAQKNCFGRGNIHIKKDGTQIHVKTCSDDVSFRGRLSTFVVAEDITERRHLHAQLVKLAHHDALTGLPNRTLLAQRMKHGFAAARERGHRAAIICLDLDRFKQINDRYGHAIGRVP